MVAYLTVADFYFKTQTIYQSIIEPFILGKGDSFVLNLYETGMVSYPTPWLIAYATLRASAATIVQQAIYSQIVNVIFSGHYPIPRMLAQAQTAVLQYGVLTLFMVAIVLVW